MIGEHARAADSNDVVRVEVMAIEAGGANKGRAVAVSDNGLC